MPKHTRPARPNELFLKQLVDGETGTKLNIACNNVKEAAAVFKRLTTNINVTEVTINLYRFGNDEFWKELLACLRTNRVLKRLTILRPRFMKFNDTEKEEMIEGGNDTLLFCDNLESLAFVGGGTPLLVLRKLSLESSQLQELQLDTVETGGLTELASTLRHQTTIRKLEFYVVPQNNESELEDMRDLLQGHGFLQNLRIKVTANPRFDALLGQVLQTNTTLQVLFLGQHLSDEERQLDFEEFSAGLASNRGLLELELEWVQIGAVGIQYLSRALSQNSCLQKLTIRDGFPDYGGSGTDDKGVLCLFQQLSNNSTLQAITLLDHAFGDAGCESIASCLIQLHATTALKSLSFDGPKMTAIGIKFILRGICMSSTLHLRELRVSCNDAFDDSCLEAVSALVKTSSCSLEHISIIYERSAISNCSILSEAMRFNRSIQVMSVSRKSSNLELDWGACKYLPWRNKVGFWRFIQLECAVALVPVFLSQLNGLVTAEFDEEKRKEAYLSFVHQLLKEKPTLITYKLG